MLKKASLLLLAVMIIPMLAACAAQQAAASSRSTNSSTSGQGQFTVSTETRLALGTMKLKGTPRALTTDQAKTLLPLWKAMKTLSSSTTVSQVEISALDDQIKGILTADQNTYIEKLDLSGQNMRTVMSDLGIQFGQGGQGNGQARTGTRTPNNNGGGGGGGFQGGPGGGGFPGGGGNFGGGAAGGTQRTPNPNATREVRVQRVNPFIANAVIIQLSEIAGVPLPSGTPGAGGAPSSPSATGTPGAGG